MLATTLSVNHLAPVGASIYKKIIQNINEDMWEIHFKYTFLKYLNSDNR